MPFSYNFLHSTLSCLPLTHRPSSGEAKWRKRLFFRQNGSCWRWLVDLRFFHGKEDMHRATKTGLMFHSGGFKPDRGGLSFMRSSDKNGSRFSPVLLVSEVFLKVNRPFCARFARKTYASRTTCDTFRREQEFGSSQGSGCTRTAWRCSDSFHVDGRFLLSKGRLRARLAGPSARDVFDRRHMVHPG